MKEGSGQRPICTPTKVLLGVGWYQRGWELRAAAGTPVRREGEAEPWSSILVEWPPVPVLSRQQLASRVCHYTCLSLCINHSWKDVLLGCVKVPLTAAGAHPFCHGHRWILSVHRDV